MNPATSVAVSVLVASAAAAGISFALRPAEKPADTTAIGDLQRAIADLRTTNDALRQRIEAIAKAPAPASAPAGAERTAAPAVSQEQIAAAVEAYLQRATAGAKGDGKAVAAAAGGPTFDLDSEFANLQASNFWKDGKLWRRLFDSGKADEALAKFEAIANANPKDAKAQMDLASAYLSVLQLSPDKGPLAEKSDQALDRVLAIDEKHWEARFTKAISYSFWPEFTGKPKQAIKHFEMLMEQQETMPVQAQDAQTYLMLGNLLERSDPARAKEVWAKGARRHPDNADLAGKIK